MMRRRAFLVGPAAMLLPVRVLAQGRRARIILFPGGSANDGYVGPFLARMEEHGFLPGRDIALIRTGSFADDILRLMPDIAIPSTIPGVLQAMSATATIPIVFANSTDPVEEGLVANMARPGGNVTGVANNWAASASKWVELLSQLVPGLQRLAYLKGPSVGPAVRVVRDGIDKAAAALGIAVLELGVGDTSELESAFRQMGESGAQAAITGTSGLFEMQTALLVSLAAPARIPMLHARPAVVDGGGLMFYGTDNRDSYVLVADQVARILNGQNPAELPVLTNDRFRLVINLKAARQIALEVPPSILARADVVIE